MVSWKRQVLRMFRRYRQLCTRYYGAPRAPRLAEEGYLFDAQGRVLGWAADWYAPVANHWRDNGVAEHIWQATLAGYIEELPERQRRIAMLYFVHGRSQRATAEALGVTRWTVRWALEGLFFYFAWVYGKLWKDKDF